MTKQTKDTIELGLPDIAKLLEGKNLEEIKLKVAIILVKVKLRIEGLLKYKEAQEQAEGMLGEKIKPYSEYEKKRLTSDTYVNGFNRCHTIATPILAKKILECEEKDKRIEILELANKQLSDKVVKLGGSVLEIKK